MKDAKVFEINGYTITAPAALVFVRTSAKTWDITPQLHNGEQVYALPAGGRITESGKIVCA